MGLVQDCINELFLKLPIDNRQTVSTWEVICVLTCTSKLLGEGMPLFELALDYILLTSEMGKQAPAGGIYSRKWDGVCK